MVAVNTQVTVDQWINMVDMDELERHTAWSIKVVRSLKKLHADGKLSEAQAVKFIVDRLEHLLKFNVAVMESMGLTQDGQQLEEVGQ